MKIFKSKNILQFFLIIVVLIEILGGYLFFNTLTLEVTTDGYGKVCYGFDVNYMEGDNVHQITPALDYTEKKFSAPLLRFQDAEEIESINIAFKIFEQQDINKLELLQISSIEIKSGILRIVKIGYAFSEFLENCDGMTLVEPELFQLNDYNTSLTLNNKIIKIAIQRMEMMTLVLLGAFLICIGIVYKYFWNDYKERIASFAKMDILVLGIYIWMQNSKLEEGILYFALIGVVIPCILLYCRIKREYIYSFISVYSALAVFTLWNYEFTIARLSAVALIVIASVCFLLYMKQRVTCIWNPCVKQEKKLSIDFFIVTVLVICYGILLSYNLMGNACYNGDEKYVLETAAGFLKSGELRQWDFVKQIPGVEYTRGSIYTYLIALAFHFFGISIEVARGVSVICGMFFIGIIYVILRKEHFPRQGAVVCSALLMLNPNLIVIFRTARMYCLLMPLSLLVIYFAYKALTCRNNFIKNNVVTKFVSNYMDFHLGYSLAFICMLYLSCWCMINSIIIVLGIYLFVLYLAVIKREKRYLVLGGLGIVIIAVAVVLYLLFCAGILIDGPLLLMQLLYNLRGNVIVRSSYNFSYMINDLSGFGSGLVGLIFFLFATICIWWKTKENMDFVRYLWLISLGSYVFFVFFANKSWQYRYMCFVQPICYIIIVFVIYRLNIYNKYKDGRYLLLTGIILLCLNVYCKNFNAVYGKNGLIGSLNVATDYTNVIDIIKDDAQDDSIILFPSWYQSYYLQDFEEVDLKAEYMYDERDKNNLEVFGGYNIDYFINSIDKNEEGYITLETPKLYHWKVTYRVFSQLFDKIAGEGLDVYNLEVFKYNVLYPQNESNSDSDVMFEMEKGLCNIMVVEKEGQNKELHIKIDKTGLPVDTKMVGMVITTEEKEYDYQLIVNEKETNYIVELEEAINYEEKIDIKEKLSIYTDGNIKEISCLRE